MKKKMVIAVIGPTATGKSALAVKISKEIDGEIISADSRQVYRGLTIGSGKITKKEMCGIPHHLIDVANPKKIFTVSDFQSSALKKIEEIHSRNKIPVICGGSGLYIDSIVYESKFPEVPPNRKLRKDLQKKSAEELLEKLKEIDPERADKIDPHNKVRIVRALEIAERLGKVPPLQANKLKYKTLFIGLKLEKDEQRIAITKRLKKRISAGLIAEAKKLRKGGLSYKRMDELGLEYRYLADYLQNKITKEEMLSQLENAIFQFSKRQITWFKRNKKIFWLNPNKKGDYKKALNLSKKFVRDEI